MAKAYWVVSYRAIHKPEAFARYAAVAPAAWIVPRMISAGKDAETTIERSRTTAG